ncbi:hypothetical protein [Celeribacter sp. PS-C1]|uniref:hypothetical protein n=1 Tax=Celeribacter sp. PS-C1 TaxID=2820813 RepID=UPI001CA4D5B9|nr:hypothetical protein [Celeribacter sp. PS-C1]MBW6416791.1 hypothetical protein [Celeribacter sp. PS-C1]
MAIKTVMSPNAAQLYPIRVKEVLTTIGAMVEAETRVLVAETATGKRIGIKAGETGRVIQIPPVDTILERRQMLLVIETFEDAKATASAAGAASGADAASGSKADEGAAKPKAKANPKPKPQQQAEPQTEPETKQKRKRKKTAPATDAAPQTTSKTNGWTMKDRFLALSMIGMIATGAYVWIADFDPRGRNFPASSDLAWLNTPERRAETAITFTPFEGVRFTSLDTTGHGNVFFAGIDDENHGFVTRFDTTANSYSTPARTETTVKSAHVLMDAMGSGVSYAAFAAVEEMGLFPYVYYVNKDGEMKDRVDINEDRFILATARSGAAVAWLASGEMTYFGTTEEKEVVMFDGISGYWSGYTFDDTPEGQPRRELSTLSLRLDPDWSLTMMAGGMQDGGGTITDPVSHWVKETYDRADGGYDYREGWTEWRDALSLMDDASAEDYDQADREKRGMITSAFALGEDDTHLVAGSLAGLKGQRQTDGSYSGDAFYTWTRGRADDSQQRERTVFLARDDIDASDGAQVTEAVLTTGDRFALLIRNWGNSSRYSAIAFVDSEGLPYAHVTFDGVEISDIVFADDEKLHVAGTKRNTSGALYPVYYNFLP